jgi:hypothetical protein
MLFTVRLLFILIKDLFKGYNCSQVYGENKPGGKIYLFWCAIIVTDFNKVCNGEHPEPARPKKNPDS